MITTMPSDPNAPPPLDKPQTTGNEIVLTSTGRAMVAQEPNEPHWWVISTPPLPTTERNKMSTDHRDNVMKLIEHVREERREIVSDIVERKGRRAVGQKEITRLRKQQELLTLLKAALEDEGG